MYKRLAEDKKKQLRQEYESVQEYLIAYNAINVVSEQFDDLCPEEVWNEALDVVDAIRRTQYRDWKVDKVFSELKRRYSDFMDECGQVVHRDKKAQEHSATMVLFDVVLMLSMAQKVAPEKAEEHPYYPYMLTILRDIGQSLLFKAMLDVAHTDEDEVEKKIVGHELQEQDYLGGERKQVVEPKSNHEALQDASIRQARLKNAYKKLKEQDYKMGASDWYYVFRMMAEKKVYERLDSYALFAADLKAIDVTLDTKVFSRKKDQFKDGPEYPYWKTKTGRKLSTMEKGLEIARIAYKELFL